MNHIPTILLTVKLVKSAKMLSFQVVHQDKHVSEFLAIGSYETNGLFIRTKSEPAITESHIHLRGSNSQQDRLVSTIVFNNDELRDAYYNKIVCALKNLCGSIRDNERAIESHTLNF